MGVGVVSVGIMGVSNIGVSVVCVGIKGVGVVDHGVMGIGIMFRYGDCLKKKYFDWFGVEDGDWRMSLR